LWERAQQAQRAVVVERAADFSTQVEPVLRWLGLADPHWGPTQAGVVRGARVQLAILKTERRVAAGIPEQSPSALFWLG
jgi:hypothetical protein